MVISSSTSCTAQAASSPQVTRLGNVTGDVAMPGRLLCLPGVSIASPSYHQTRSCAPTATATSPSPGAATPRHHPGPARHYKPVKPTLQHVAEALPDQPGHNLRLEY